MGTTRFFSGGREPGKRNNPAGELMRLEIQKKGKLPAADRYKQILRMKLQESRDKAIGKPKFSMTGSKETRQISKRAELALKEMAAKKAAKEAKKLRNMVIVTPRNFYNGSINNKGKIHDIAGNLVAEVNIKNGKMATTMGWGLGKYKAKSKMTELVIQEGINKFSPYYINLRKMQAMQQGIDPSVSGIGPMHQDTLNLHGHSSIYGYAKDGGSLFSGYGTDAGGPRQNIGVTGWGAMSDNVWGTFADNAWGQSMDNVWGGNSSDVWGGIGGNPWGNFSKSVRIFGTGNGHNYLKGLTSRVAAFFGLNLGSKKGNASVHETLVRKSSSNRTAAHESGNARSSAGSSRSGGGSTRSAPVRSTTTRR